MFVWMCFELNTYENFRWIIDIYVKIWMKCMCENLYAKSHRKLAKIIFGGFKPQKISQSYFRRLPKPPKISQIAAEI